MARNNFQFARLPGVITVFVSVCADCFCYADFDR
jgi:hypothetical protein